MIAKRPILFVCLSLAIMLLVGGFAFKLTKSLLGHTLKGTAWKINELPKFSRELSQFHASGPIYYHLYQQWGRHIMFVSGTTTLQTVSNFAVLKGMDFHPASGNDTDLKHMAFTCQVNTQLVVTSFSDTDALASKRDMDLGRYCFLRYRYSDGRFTLLCFN